jgi:intergrase/recombinase
MALSGLRVEESLNAIKIFKEKRDEYLNNELKILEHFRYPHTFIRKSKKAFITVLDDGMMEALEKSKPITYNMLKSFLFRKSVNISLNYFRKIYATFLRQKGIEIEIIDLLQGRIPNNIFLRHYYRPELKLLIEKIRPLISELRTTLFH